MCNRFDDPGYAAGYNEGYDDRDNECRAMRKVIVDLLIKKGLIKQYIDELNSLPDSECRVHDISEKYVIIRGCKPILSKVFDTEQDAKTYLEENYMHPVECRIKKCKDV